MAIRDITRKGVKRGDWNSESREVHVITPSRGLRLLVGTKDTYAAAERLVDQYIKNLGR